MVVKVDGTVVAAGANTYSLTATPVKSATASDLEISFVKAFLEANKGKSVEVSYEAKVTGDAVIGSAGNSNAVKLEYTKEPGSSETQTTEKVETSVYSYGIQIEKFTKEDGTKALKGAEFTLYSDAACSKEVGSKISDTNGQLTFSGIKDGTYYIKETKSPTGYTLLSDVIKVEVIATRDGNGKIASYTMSAKVNEQAISATSGTYVTKINATSGVLSVAIENHKGFTLPSSGGMGITLFLVVGGIGMVSAVIYLSKKTKKEQA